MEEIDYVTLVEDRDRFRDYLDEKVVAALIAIFSGIPKLFSF